MLFATKSKRAAAHASHDSVATDQNGHAQSTGAQRVESLLEYATSAGLRPRVDAAGGILHGVKVLGLSSRNGRRYRAACISDAAHLYEGIKVNVNHASGPRRAPRDYQDRLGCLREVNATEQGLFAELHFNPRHAVAEGQSQGTRLCLWLPRFRGNHLSSAESVVSTMSSSPHMPE